MLNSNVRLEGTVGGKDRKLQDVLKGQFGENASVKEMRKKHPATMGEKLDEALPDLESFRNIDAKEWEREDVLKHASGQKIYDRDKKEEVSLLEYIHAGKAGETMKKTVGDAEKKISGDSATSDDVLRMIDPRNIDLEKIDPAKLTNEMTVKILTEQNPVEVRETVRKRPELHSLLRGDRLDNIKASGLAQDKTEDRSKFRTNLLGALTSMGRTDAISVSFDVNPAGDFVDDDAKEDFSQAVKTNNPMALQMDVPATPTSMSKTLASSMNPSARTSLLDQYENALTSTEQDTLYEKITNLVTSHAAHSADLQTEITTLEAGNKEDKQKAKKMKETNARLKKEYQNFNRQATRIYFKHNPAPPPPP